MSNKVFLVTSGEYSSYHVHGAYTTRYRANKAKKVFALALGDDMRVETMPLNEMPTLYTHYRVEIDCMGKIIRRAKFTILEPTTDGAVAWKNSQPVSGNPVAAGHSGESHAHAAELARTELAKHLPDMIERHETKQAEIARKANELRDQWARAGVLRDSEEIEQMLRDDG